MPYARKDKYSTKATIMPTCSSSSSSIPACRSLAGAKIFGMEMIQEIALPPSLQRFITAPATTRQQQTQLKTVLRLTKEDLESVTANGNTLTFRNSQNTAKNLVKYNFDHLFSPDVTQQQICSVCLPDLLQSCFNGSDSCFLYFGASKGKADLLYLSSRSTSISSRSLSKPSSLYNTTSCSFYPGIFPAALLLTFRLISEFRHRRPDFRHSVRISALHFSQRQNVVSDLLAPTLNGTRPEVNVYEDSALGIRIENQRELRVDSAEQGMQFMNEIMHARQSMDDNDQRCSHVFFYINLYRYKTNGSQVVGGRSRFCLVDLGLGEKNSKGDSQALTMPVITNLLVALFQGQRHLPSRQNPLCMLLKDSLQNVRSKATLLFSLLSDRIAENDNIIQMLLKVQRAAKPRKTARIGSDSSSLGSIRRRLNNDSEANSSSEQSCAETVIYLGPSVRGDPARATQKTTVHSIDRDKRSMIIRWMEGSKTELHCPTKVSVEVQCNDTEMDNEMKQYFSQHRPLDDIIEDDEESFSPSSKEYAAVDQFLDTLQSEEKAIDNQLDHPLSILSLEKNFASTSGRSSSENEIDDDDLERAMAASVSSIRSHEILSRLNEDLPVELFDDLPLTCDFGNEEHETYLDDKILIANAENVEKKKTKKFPLLNCCQNSMMSSGSSSGFTANPIKKCTVEMTSKSGATSHDSRPGPSSALSISRPSTLNPLNSGNKCTLVYSGSATAARRLAQPPSSNIYKPVWIEPIHKGKPSKKIDSLGSAKTFSENSVFQDPSDVIFSNTGRIGRRESLDSKKDSKKSKRLMERRNSVENDFRLSHTLPSPYSKITDARNDAGAYSSGHGSDENGSVYCRPLITLLSSRTNRPRNRESFSASSGYESASGESKNNATTTRKRLLETKRYKPPDEMKNVMEKRINRLIQKQKFLREELREAKRILGLNEDHFISATSTALQGKTLYEALAQETKILEKRLVACRNHAMVVTCLL